MKPIATSILTLFFCSLASLSFFPVTAHAVEKTIDLSGVVCSKSSGLTCRPKYRTRLRTGKVLQVQYTASAQHCSQIIVRFFVDGKLKRSTGALNPGEASIVYRIRGLTAGRHTLSLQAVGVVGGCNTGYTASWTGSLYVKS
ncbi:MAG: hypothetical protein KDD64_13995 [Bdellovibrionales bacterium]|nr:hypothetical protein [Bdellovibrionales bacterium]